MYSLFVGAWAVVALATWSTINQMGAKGVVGDLSDQPFFYISLVNLTLFAAVLGARNATEEFRYGMVVGAVLSTRRRGVVLAAKSVVAGVVGAILATTALALMTGLAIVLASTSPAFEVSGNDLRTMAGIVAAVSIWAVLGTAVGVAVRHQVAATLGVVVWILVVENLGAGLMGGAGRYLPGQAGQGLGDLPDTVSAPLAALLLLAYGSALLLTAHFSLTKRDL